MRLILIADVHANWDALLALQRAEAKPDAVLFAGDAAGYGPEPADCVRWLLANATAAVKGNLDEGVVRGGMPPGVPAELEDAARETLGYSRAVLSPQDLAGLSQWPESATIALGGVRFYLTHGTPANPWAGELNPATCPEADLHRLFDDIPAEVILLGHTHVPAIRRFGDRLIVNPGSLGQPRYGTPDATYAIWDDGHVQIKHLHYDHDAVARKVRLMPLDPDVADQLTKILETGLT